MAAALCAAGARAEPIQLLSVANPLMAPPPLPYGATYIETENERRFPSHVSSSERIAVGIEGDGFVKSIVVTQRLLVFRTGDFAFLVPAPATAVARTPASQADPGLRDAGIVWQGFSTGRRVLEAAITLSTRDAEPALPLTISVERKGDSTVVTLDNKTGRRATYLAGLAPAGQVRDVVTRLRAARRKSGRLAFSQFFAVEGERTGQKTTLVRLPLRLSGSITVPGRPPVHVTGRLDDRRQIAVPGGVAPRIELRVDLPDDLELLPRVEDVARSGLVEVTPVQVALARTALASQFRWFVNTPDAGGPSNATYVYRTVAAEPTAAPASPGRRDGSDDTLAIVLAAALGGAALVGLGVLWAYS